MKKIIHPIAGVVAMLTIMTFWVSTVLSELFGSQPTIVAVKSAIPWGFLLLVPALAATGGSGFALAKGARGGLIGSKLKRMPFIAANGILVLIPAALYLAAKAKAGDFDPYFYVVQVIELVAGAVNLSLLGLNMRDGLRLTGRLHRMKQPAVEVTLTGMQTVAEGTAAFRFKKPEGFKHRAGQWAVFSFPDPTETDGQGNARTFTIASAPHEPDIMITTRLRDTAFKRMLVKASEGAVLRIEGPGGELILHEEAARPAVFLAGGIGITPFLAIARDAAHRGLPHDITLFYSNRRQQDAAFLDEFEALERSNPRFKLVATLTGQEESAGGARFESGVIDLAMLNRHLADILMPIYYLAGPAGMVAAMRKLLEGAGVKPADIRAEEFYGY